MFAEGTPSCQEGYRAFVEHLRAKKIADESTQYFRERARNGRLLRGKRSRAGMRGGWGGDKETAALARAARARKRMGERKRSGDGVLG